MQAEVNIGMVGHVDHGKTSLTRALTGTWTDTHSEELKRGITIKIGYADTTFYKNDEGAYAPQPQAEKEKGKWKVSRHVSFLDAPGHETLMTTTIAASSILDGAVLVIAANEICPQPQTEEHLQVLDILGIKNVVVVQNKIDLVTKEKAVENYNQIKKFLKGSSCERAPIVPISANYNANIDKLVEAIEKTIPTPKHDESLPARMYVARSFDVNKPGTRAQDLRGGVFGGSLIQGSLKVGDDIEIVPGRKVEEEGRSRWENLHTHIVSLMVGGQSVGETHSGGLIAVGTSIDPAYTKADSLVGRMLGAPGTLPKQLHRVTVEAHLLDYVVGAGEDIKVEKIRTGELLMLSVGAATDVGTVKGMSGAKVDMDLKMPVAADFGDRVAISRRFGARWRLIGHGVIQK